MSKISDKLNIIDNAKNDIKTAIENKGVNVGDIGIQEYASKIGEIEGATPITKGLKINAFDENGRATDIEIVGFAAIPSSYLYYAGYNNGWLAKGSRLKIANGTLNTSNNTFNRSNVTYVDLPPSLVVIGSAAFRESNLNLIDIPVGVTKIADTAFYSCTNLKQVISRATTPPTLGSNAFKNSPIGYSTPTGFIYVPDESIDTYKSATNWSAYASAIKGLSELEG